MVVSGSYAHASTPNLFLPLDQFDQPPVNAYVDTDPKAGSVSTWQGPVADMCVSWDTSFQVSMCIETTYDGHNGTDYNAPNQGSSTLPFLARAAADGLITTMMSGQMNNQGCACFGNYIVLDHGDGWETVYGHLASISPDLEVGQNVVVNQYLGEVGSTGDSSGPHLHFEVRHDGIAMDPYSDVSVWCEGEVQFYSGQPCGSNKPRWHPAGTILRVSGKPEYYRLGEDGYLHHIMNEDVYLGNGYSWDQAVFITPLEKSCYTLSFPLKDVPTYGIIEVEKLFGLMTEYWFYYGNPGASGSYRRRIDKKGVGAVALSWGITAFPDLTANADELFDTYAEAPGYQHIRNGSLFQEEGSPVIYYMENGKRRWIHDWETFVYAGYSMDNVLMIEEGALEHVGGTLGSQLTTSFYDQCMNEVCESDEQTSMVLCPGNSIMDIDADGFAAWADCNDHNPKQFPGNKESYDMLDNDCDGEVDETSFIIAVEDDPTEEDDTPADPCETADCDDGNPCTNDACQDGACTHLNNNNPCDDGDMCTVGGLCSGGTCYVGQDICECKNNTDCDDGKVCTQNVCDLNGQCQVVLTLGLGCDDGDPCTTGDVCYDGLCVPGEPTCTCYTNTDCNDSNPCTDDVCDEGSCWYVLNDNPCTDGDQCTANVCMWGECTAIQTCECTSDSDCISLDPKLKGSCTYNECIFEEVLIDPPAEPQVPEESSDPESAPPDPTEEDVTMSLLESGGLIENGSFEKGEFGWFKEIHEWETATIALDCSDAFDGYCSMKTDVKSPQSFDYMVQLVSNASIEAGETYMVSCAARASALRTMRVWMGDTNPPWDIYGLNNSLNIEPEWKTFKIVFTATETDVNAKFAFVLGQSTVPIWIDTVSITKISN